MNLEQPNRQQRQGNLSQEQQVKAQMSLADLYKHWDEFRDVPTVYEGENVDCIEQPFLHFDAGTHREEVWHWFESQNPRFIVGEVMAGVRHSDEQGKLQRDHDRRPSALLKSQILAEWGSSARPIHGCDYVAGLQDKTGRLVVVVDGTFDREVFKTAITEARARGAASLHDAVKMHVFCDLATYAGHGIEVTKFEDLAGVFDRKLQQGHQLDAHEMSPAWTQANDDAAAREGWNIWDSAGSVNGRWQLQRIDDADAFEEAAGFVPVQLKSDDDAFQIVANGTEPHHEAARSFLKAHNPAEYEAVMGFKGRKLQQEQQMGAKLSYLVAVVGKSKGVLAQCFAKDEAQANRTTEALFLDTFGESGSARCIDTGAAAGTWIEGDPEYIRAQIESRGKLPQNQESQGVASAVGAALQILESIRVTHPELIADNAPVGWGMNRLRQELGKVSQDCDNRELGVTLEKLIPHVLHYAAMPHAHSAAFKDAADARAVLARLHPSETIYQDREDAESGKLQQNNDPESHSFVSSPLRQYIDQPELVAGWVTNEAVVVLSGEMKCTEYFNGALLRSALDTSHPESHEGLWRRFDAGERFIPRQLPQERKHIVITVPPISPEVEAALQREALAKLKEALGLATDSGLFDEMQIDMPGPDLINNFCDAVADFELPEPAFSVSAGPSM